MSRAPTLYAVKKRIDVLLVERGLAESRAQAQALVMAGRVPGFAKAGEQVEEDAHLTVDAPPRFVSRAGEKLENALDRLGLDVRGVDALDLGASTGGFTDCLLQRGAAHVVALDVAYGELHWSLRTDERVTAIERVNARSLACDALPYAPDLVVLDELDLGLARDRAQALERRRDRLSLAVEDHRRAADLLS